MRTAVTDVSGGHPRDWQRASRRLNRPRRAVPRRAPVAESTNRRMNRRSWPGLVKLVEAGTASEPEPGRRRGGACAGRRAPAAVVVATGAWGVPGRARNRHRRGRRTPGQRPAAVDGVLPGGTGSGFGGRHRRRELRHGRHLGHRRHLRHGGQLRHRVACPCWACPASSSGRRPTRRLHSGATAAARRRHCSSFPAPPGRRHLGSSRGSRCRCSIGPAAAGCRPEPAWRRPGSSWPAQGPRAASPPAPPRPRARVFEPAAA